MEADRMMQMERTFRPALIDEMRELERQMGEAVNSGAVPLAECPLVHTFSDRQYGRSIFLPAGTLAVGKRHRHAHIMIMSVGDITIATDDGEVRMTGFQVLESPAGVKRCVYAHADTIITTVHVTDETDITKLESSLVMPDTPAIEGETS